MKGRYHSASFSDAVETGIKSVLTQVVTIDIGTPYWVVHVNPHHWFPLKMATIKIKKTSSLWVITAVQPFYTRCVFEENPNVVSKWHTRYHGNWMPPHPPLPPPPLLLTIVARKKEKRAGSNLNSASAALHCTQQKHWMTIITIMVLR